MTFGNLQTFTRFRRHQKWWQVRNSQLDNPPVDNLPTVFSFHRAAMLSEKRKRKYNSNGEIIAWRFDHFEGNAEYYRMVRKYL